jgi:hypothetical protein
MFGSKHSNMGKVAGDTTAWCMASTSASRYEFLHLIFSQEACYSG